MNENRLMSLKEFKFYIGVSDSTARRIVKNPRNAFSVRVGGRWYVDRIKFDNYLESCERCRVAIPSE